MVTTSSGPSMSRRRGAPAADPANPIRIVIGFSAGEQDRELVERLANITGARSISEAIRGAIRNEFARVSGNA
jgi:hypothetical protein